MNAPCLSAFICCCSDFSTVKSAWLSERVLLCAVLRLQGNPLEVRMNYEARWPDKASVYEKYHPQFYLLEYPNASWMQLLTFMQFSVYIVLEIILLMGIADQVPKQFEYAWESFLRWPLRNLVLILHLSRDNPMDSCSSYPYSWINTLWCGSFFDPSTMHTLCYGIRATARCQSTCFLLILITLREMLPASALNPLSYGEKLCLAKTIEGKTVLWVEPFPAWCGKTFSKEYYSRQHTYTTAFSKMAWWS